MKLKNLKKHNKVIYKSIKQWIHQRKYTIFADNFIIFDNSLK